MVTTVNAREFGPGEFNRNFYTKYEKRPVLIKEEVAHWDAARKWDPEYLDCALGHQEVDVKYLEEEVLSLNHPENLEEKTAPFSEARRDICEEGNFYLSQVPIEVPLISRVLGGMSTDFSRLAVDIQQPRFLKDISKRCFVTNLWFGGDLCKTPLHFDDQENFFVQLFGKKRIMLFAPSQTDYLYPAYGKTHSHISRVNVFDPDESRFPRFSKANWTEVIVKPGDMLYIPKNWWHAVETIDTSISVNFWWTGLLRHMQLELSLLSDRLIPPLRTVITDRMPD